MTDRRVDYGDDTAGRYARGRSLDDRSLAACVHRVPSLALDARLASSTVVDIGAGTGVFAGLDRLGAERVVGIEPSPAMLSEAAVRPSAPDVSYVRAIGERLPLALVVGRRGLAVHGVPPVRRR